MDPHPPTPSSTAPQPTTQQPCVPGDQQEALRKAVRVAIRKRADHPVRTHAINGVIYVECQVLYDRYAHQNDREAADAVDAVLKGEPLPQRERDWVISWAAWGVT